MNETERRKAQRARSRWRIIRLWALRELMPLSGQEGTDVLLKAIDEVDAHLKRK